MEIGNQCINNLKAIVGMDKNIRLAITSADNSFAIGRMLERAGGRRSKGDYPALPGLASSNGCGRLHGDSVEFPVHPVFTHLFDPHRKKGSEADMECEMRNINPA